MKRIVPTLVASVLFAMASPSARAVLDLDSDGLPDVWQRKHGVGPLAPTADTDGDGVSNEIEAAAGSNPLVAGDFIRINSSQFLPDGAHLTFNTLSGKRYQVEQCSALGSPWTNVGPLLVGLNGDFSTVVPVGSGTIYLRVRVAEVDTDGDGLTDWEELELGYNPNTPSSNGLSEPNDLARATAALQAQPVVSIETTDGVASEVGLKAGLITIRRTGGVGLVSVPLVVSGAAFSGSDFVPLPISVTLPLGVNAVSLLVTPLADAMIESDENVSVSLGVPTGGIRGASTMATVLISDDIQANGAGLAASFYNEAVTMNATTVGPAWATLADSRVDPVVDYSWASSTVKGVGSPSPLVNTDYFACRWTGDVLPEYTQTYTFKTTANIGSRLWVNGQLLINNWVNNGLSGAANGTYTGTISLVAGKRYALVLEHFETTGSAEMRLRWSSASRPEEVIPAARMFAAPPPRIETEAPFQLLKNGPLVTIPIRASWNPTSYTASNLPPGWTINPASGVISGSPTTVGVWEVAVTATNSNGTAASVISLEVFETEGSLTLETWNSVSSLASLPLDTPPASTSSVSSFETTENSGESLGQRLRGYLTAPETGIYRFWLTGDDQAELWISNDHQGVNLFRRSKLSGRTALRAWSAAPSCSLLWLEAGKRYYVEARHFDASGPDHLSVGWLKPSQSGGDPAAATGPSEVIPGYALSPFVSPAVVPGTASLYTSTLTAETGVATGGFGSASLGFNFDASRATIRFSYGNLTSAKTNIHIRSAAHAGLSLFNLGAASLQTDGSYLWTLAPVGALSAAEVAQVIRDGQAYVRVDSFLNPNGELNGFFRFHTGSQNFIAPPAAPAWTTDHTERAAAVRFLTQATFGSDETSITAVNTLGYEGWIDQQMGLPLTAHYPEVYSKRTVTNPQNPTYPGTILFNTWWKNSLTAPDQLRQRMAFALSEILVVSESGPLDDRADALSTYYDMLLEHSFGNFRTLLEEATLNPAMGRYLDMLRNERPNKAAGRIPNENYAREILQLFSIGLYRMHPDGSLVLDSQGQAIPTYGQEEIIGFAHAFTGWNYNQPDSGVYKPTNWSPSSDWLNPMKEVPARHDIGVKRILNNEVLPGLPKVVTTTTASPITPVTIVLNPDTDYNSNNDVRNSQAFQDLARQELAATHDAIFQHPNTGPFLCRQLIQRLVTSTPSLGYVYRVTSVFNDNGSGVRGDLAAVLKAILLDHEARSSDPMAAQGYGKQREPVLRVTALARAFPEPTALSGTYQQTDNVITITTTTAHRLASGNPVVLGFSTASVGSPPTTGSYTLSGSFPITTNGFSVRPKEVVTMNSASQSATTVTVTSNGHGLATGMQIFLKFTGGVPASGSYPITYVDGNNFSFQALDSANRTGLTGFYVLHKGGYTMPANSTTVTVTAGTNHRLSTNDLVYLKFYPTSGQTTTPTVGVYPVTVVNETIFTFANPTTFTSSRSGTFALSPVNPVLSFSGNLSGSFRSYSMNDTETDLAQTPLRSPTVFNYFLPDYQFPGAIASNGLTTPEFQLSSETNLMRQSNLISSAIFNPTTGVQSSFRSGSGVIGMDFTKWMGARTGGTGLWTDTINLGALVQELNVLLCAGQLSPSAVTIIQNYAGTLSYTAATPTDTQKRDRVRAIVHLIATSPDFAIQR